jgi:hypothetical protein
MRALSSLLRPEAWLPFGERCADCGRRRRRTSLPSRGIARAAGDILLDASGNRMLDASGNLVLSNGTDDSCCCGCKCNYCSESGGTAPCTALVTFSDVTWSSCCGGWQINSLSINGTYCLSMVSDVRTPGGFYGGYCGYTTTIPCSAILYSNSNCTGTELLSIDTATIAVFVDYSLAFNPYQIWVAGGSTSSGGHEFYAFTINGYICDGQFSGTTTSTTCDAGEYQVYLGTGGSVVATPNGC